MAKHKKSLVTKAKEAAQQRPEEFIVSHKGELYCRLCGVQVSVDKAALIESHRNSNKHQSLLRTQPTQQHIKSFSHPNKISWSYKVTKAFLEADIPLHKLNSEPIKNLFKSIDYELPCYSASYKCVDIIYENQMQIIRAKFVGQDVFYVIDESEIRGQRYVSSLIGLVVDPSVTYLVDCKPIKSSPNASLICLTIDDVLKENQIDRSNFLLLLSDAARYMVAAGNALKMMYPKLHTITCISHMLHNCAIRVKIYFNDVDKLIASVKASTVKNKTRQALFDQIGQPPQPIVTRWGSWINAAEYYSQHFTEIKSIVDAFEEDGILVNKAKESINCQSVRQSLMQISRDYACLANLITKTESSSYTVEQAIKDFEVLDFGEDICNIKAYVSDRLKKNDILKITQMENASLTPYQYSKLLKCQPTTCSVERSFSLLGKLLRKDRNFDPLNVKKYIIAIYNKFL